MKKESILKGKTFNIRKAADKAKAEEKGAKRKRKSGAKSKKSTKEGEA